MPEAWTTAQAQEVGVPTTFSLQGAQVQIEAADPEVSSVSAPLTFGLSPNGVQPVLAFEDASVDEGSLTGLLVVVGTFIDADQGSLLDVGVVRPSLGGDGVSLELPLAEDDGTRPSLGVDGDPEHQQALEVAAPVDVTLQEVRISGYEQAYVVTPTETIALAGPFSVSAERMYWPTSSAVYADAIEARYEGEVFFGIDTVDGEAQTEYGPLAALPGAVWGRDAALSVGVDHVQTLEPMPVRQALDAEGVLVPSVVELSACEPEVMYVSPGQIRTLRFAYRQSDGRSDAVFSDVRVEPEDGSAPWNVRIQLDGTLPTRLTDAAETYSGYSWGQFIVDYVEFWVDFTEAFVEGVTCVFTLGFICGDDDDSSGPPPLDDYPAWMLPGDVGEFELEVEAPYEPGEYRANVVVEGENYDTSVPITIVVR